MKILFQKFRMLLKENDDILSIKFKGSRNFCKKTWESSHYLEDGESAIIAELLFAHFSKSLKKPRP